ncbi:hypothetical protein ABBQ32_006733 [Trebouxia sp. C0010 RCD-2024]
MAHAWCALGIGGVGPRPTATLICNAVSSPKPQPGKCWLVGSGPGSTEHLTLKAVRLIKDAKVIVYDDLGTQAALDEYASPQAERRYVGKRGQKESIKQRKIDSLLVNLCQQGQEVVRLKGGCPSTFSRVGSELKALAAAGIPHEMVPGVSSALAAPVLAGFPLTDAQVSSSYTVLTAHAPDQVDWANFAGLDTLVLLMAARNLQLIMQHLLRTGWSPQTPVSVCVCVCVWQMLLTV